MVLRSTDDNYSKYYDNSESIIMPIVFAKPIIPNQSNLLIHSDTTNGSTSFVDSSINVLTINTNGTGTQHSTSEAKFGATAIRFSGSGNLLVPEVGGGLEGKGEFYLGGEDFTVDCWVKFDSIAPNAQVIVAQGKTSTSDAITVFQIRSRTDGKIEAALNFGGLGDLATAIGVVGISQFHHIAYVRTGNTFLLFVDGVQEATTSTSGSQTNGINSNLSIGRRGDGGNDLTGYIDEFRFVQGKAVWTANFTPPTAPYTS